MLIHKPQPSNIPMGTLLCKTRPRLNLGKWKYMDKVCSRIEQHYTCNHQHHSPLEAYVDNSSHQPNLPFHTMIVPTCIKPNYHVKPVEKKNLLPAATIMHQHHSQLSLQPCNQSRHVTKQWSSISTAMQAQTSLQSAYCYKSHDKTVHATQHQNSIPGHETNQVQRNNIILQNQCIQETQS